MGKENSILEGSARNFLKYGTARGKKKNPHISQILVVALKSFFVKAEVHVGKNAR